MYIQKQFCIKAHVKCIDLIPFMYINTSYLGKNHILFGRSMYRWKIIEMNKMTNFKNVLRLTTAKQNLWWVSLSYFDVTFLCLADLVSSSVSLVSSSASLVSSSACLISHESPVRWTAGTLHFRPRVSLALHGVAYMYFTVNELVWSSMHD